MPSAGGRCPACGFDPPTVSPSDAAVAARSFPRRFRVLLVRPDDRDPDIVHRRPAAGGLSAAGHAFAAAAGMDAAAGALVRVRVAEAPTVDIEAGPALTADEQPLEVVLERVATAAGALAAAVEGTRGSEWARPGRLPGGEEVTALDLTRAGVHAGAHHLRAAERTIAEVR
jgi:hypothetical protein